jgi:2-amino-4-hydroxy-6-hydroxymethyldihydropteridine diphosphokinase
MKTVYLSLGSNVGDREEMLRAALRLLESPGLHVVRVSPVYETEPQDFKKQPWFLNLVAEIQTGLFPMQLLTRVRRIERELGRKRTVDKGPRSIDIDILLYGESVIDSEDLVVPHPRMTERRFVLQPLADLAPDLRHPVLRRSVKELLAAVSGQAVRQHAAKLT